MGKNDKIGLFGSISKSHKRMIKCDSFFINFLILVCHFSNIELDMLFVAIFYHY